MKNKHIMFIGVDSVTSHIIINELIKIYPSMSVMFEDKTSYWNLIKRRAYKLGIWNTSGQILFLLIVKPWLMIASYARLKEIKRGFNFDENKKIKNAVRVRSVNSDESISSLQEADPGIVVVHGTRIISHKVLNSISAEFINMHAGITPSYRGCHGMYWALYEGLPELAGVTIHKVDTGIDTGNIYKQIAIKPNKKDSYITYPYLQLGHGVKLLIETVKETLSGRVEIAKINQNHESKLYHHPTLWQYIKGMWRGVY